MAFEYGLVALGGEFGGGGEVAAGAASTAERASATASIVASVLTQTPNFEMNARSTLPLAATNAVRSSRRKGD
ncbi:hypothetical protein ACFC0K_36395 [Streptomyces hydrogenans]|uniref:hypothetical protein n=1 Tax=Streptomyces hydrogenans TaxID=1873719 RepID=UPI0035DEC270